MRTLTKIVISSSPIAVKYHQMSLLGGEPEALGQAEGTRPARPNPRESIGLIPNDPFVRLKPPKLSPFRITCGRISPNPSVTMAR